MTESGTTGTPLAFPYLREGSFVLSGYRGVDIWFAPIPLNDYGGIAQRFRELDLTGSSGKNYRRQDVVDWHRLMGRTIQEMDHNKHMVSTHVSGNYHNQNVDIISLDEMSLCPVDAYHHSEDPVQIVQLLKETAEFNAKYGKPVVVTEFGGTPYAQSLRHLDASLHAALWASACIPLGSAPMFWWWQLIEEENFYPKFEAFSRYMAGEDRRDPELQISVPEIRTRDTMEDGIDIQCLKNKTRAFGWIYVSDNFEETDPAGPQVCTNVTVRLDNMSAGSFEIEYWDTISGKPSSKESAASDNGSLLLKVPPFARDTAFKVKPSR